MSSIRCPECNLTNWATSVACKRCGFLFQEAQPGNDGPGHQTFEDFQPQSIADSQPANQYQEQWAHHRRYTDPHAMGYGNYQPQKQKVGLAVASLVFGLIGCLFSPVGLICGIVALRKNKANPREYGGHGLAIAGIILSAINLVSIPIIAAVAIPNLLAARRAANEGSAI